jgi:signal transduction histidine kinase
VFPQDRSVKSPPGRVRQARPPQRPASRLERQAEIEAKRSLARELHDSVAQILTLMVVDMENFKHDQAGERHVVQRVDSLQQSTREVLRNLRNALSELREQPTEDRGFAQSVRDLLARFQRGSGIHTRLSVSDGWPSQISTSVTHQLYRIVEEALNNVRYHSGAANVDVCLESLGDWVRLTVRDDGHGMSSDGGKRIGMGLIGMRERAALLGAELDVMSNGDGTTVEAIVPKTAREYAR